MQGRSVRILTIILAATIIVAAGCVTPKPVPDQPRFQWTHQLSVPHSNFTFEDSLQKWALHATKDTAILLNFSVAVPLLVEGQNCVVARIGQDSYRLQEPTVGYLFVVGVDGRVDAKGQVAGQEVDTGGASPPVQLIDGEGFGGIEGGFDVRAGETLIVEIGGSIPSFAEDLLLELAWEDSVWMEQLPPVPLACGDGVHQATGATVGASGYLDGVSIRGQVPFASDAGVTFVASGQVDWSWAHVELGDQTLDLGRGFQQLNATGPVAGALVFDAWVGLPDSLLWIFVGEDWGRIPEPR